jgi:anaerobic selenocysteine-containing dehydrogenase
MQWGGQYLFAGGRFATSDGRARFTAVEVPPRRAAEGRLALSTRRGKQFNSMVQRDVDPITGAGREDVLISPEDAAGLLLRDGERVRLVSEAGSFDGRARISPIKPGNLQVHWPEAQALLPAGNLDPASREPDYNAEVRIEKS